MQKRKINKHAKKPVGFLIFVLVLLIGVVSIQVSNLYNKNIELTREADLLEKEIQAELEEQESLLAFREYMDSKEYIEEMAREKLGLVVQDEVLFLEKSE